MVRMGDEKNRPEEGCETGGVRNVGVVVGGMNMGEYVSTGMLHCLQELKNLKKKVNGLMEWDRCEEGS